MAVDLGGQVKSLFGVEGGGGAQIFSFVTWLVIIVVVAAVLGFLAYLFVRNMKFNKKIVVFEKIGGNWIPTIKDRAISMRHGDAGDTIFFARKHKKYLPTPRIQTGANTFWYCIREDGEWINFTLGDIDMQMKKAGAHYLDKEMRYARTAIYRQLKDRYDKPNFWKQYGLLVMGLGYIALIGVMTFLLFDKWITLAGTTNAGVETAGQVMEKSKEIMATLSRICQGGSGFTPSG